MAKKCSGKKIAGCLRMPVDLFFAIRCFCPFLRAGLDNSCRRKFDEFADLQADGVV
jgi:hypothetical protein